eukprot:UN00512
MNNNFEIKTYTSPGKGVLCGCLTSNNVLYMGCATIIHEYNINTDFVLTGYLKGHNNFVKCLCLSSDDSFLYSGGFGCELRQWSLNNSEFCNKWSLNKYSCKKVNFEGHSDNVTCCCLSSNDTVLYSGSWDCSYR